MIPAERLLDIPQKIGRAVRIQCHRLDVEEQQIVRRQTGRKSGAAHRGARDPVELRHAVLPVRLLDQRVRRLQDGPGRAADQTLVPDHRPRLDPHDRLEHRSQQATAQHTLKLVFYCRPAIRTSHHRPPVSCTKANPLRHSSPAWRTAPPARQEHSYSTADTSSRTRGYLAGTAVSRCGTRPAGRGPGPAPPTVARCGQPVPVPARSAARRSTGFPTAGSPGPVPQCTVFSAMAANVPRGVGSPACIRNGVSIEGGRR